MRIAIKRDQINLKLGDKLPKKLHSVTWPSASCQKTKISLRRHNIRGLEDKMQKFTDFCMFSLSIYKYFSYRFILYKYVSNF